jgi:peroxiredoxin Q/BCP
MPEAGETAPAFEGATQDGKTLSLAALRGKKVALFFYPADFTPGCTAQACNLRDEHQDLIDAGIAVVGVSPDDAASHGKFAEEYRLPFPLVADPDKKILNSYGAWGEKNMYGKKSMGVKRTTFLIDEDGTIMHVFKRPDTKAHAEEILKKLGK